MYIIIFISLFLITRFEKSTRIKDDVNLEICAHMFELSAYRYMYVHVCITNKISTSGNFFFSNFDCVKRNCSQLNYSCSSSKKKKEKKIHVSHSCSSAMQKDCKKKSRLSLFPCTLNFTDQHLFACEKNSRDLRELHRREYYINCREQYTLYK